MGVRTHAASLSGPALRLDEPSTHALAWATTAVGRLSIAANIVLSAEWFLYGFVRKEGLIASQIEGAQATLRDLLAFKAGERPQGLQLPRRTALRPPRVVATGGLKCLCWA